MVRHLVGDTARRIDGRRITANFFDVLGVRPAIGRTFVEVAQRGSLSAAAREEGITPAMVGRRIDQLEERL